MTRTRCGIARLKTLRYVGAMRMAVLGLAMALGGCAGYTPGQKAYWDAKVREMCAKDGGVRILEKMRLSAGDLRLLTRKNGVISVLDERFAKPDSPVYGVMKKEVIRSGDPSISRTEAFIVRRKDRKVMATWVLYGRSGGDFPSHAYPSLFLCPDLSRISSEVQQMFIIEEQGSE